MTRNTRIASSLTNIVTIMMMTIICTCCCSKPSECTAPENVARKEYNPKANPKAEVICENARFTVLTDRLIRMEWAENGQFEDRASLAIVNRNLPVPKYKTEVKDGVLTIKTKKVTLKYNPNPGTVTDGVEDNGKFSENNLYVTFKLNGEDKIWHPGSDESANLRGTMRTLDGIAGRANKTCMGYYNWWTNSGLIPAPMENGILSRDGWAVIDESQRILFEEDDSDWGEWFATRPAGDRQDLYIFAYGHDYTEALADYVKVAGDIPLPPKYAFGYWWSRYWAYTDEEFLGIASELRERQVPLDVFIVDMDWHKTWKDLDDKYGRDEYGQGHGWTGYTWNRDLIRDPEQFLKDLHKYDVKIALNLHPASGIQWYEEPYERFVKDYLSRTDDYDGPKDFIYTDEPYIYAGNTQSYARKGKPAGVPFRLDQRAWAESYFETVLRPMENMGVDFWWLDWQQWLESKYTPGLSNTFLCNWVFWNDQARRATTAESNRPIIYHRWGGLGSHRYQLGFSGDTMDNWEVLGALPYFTATSSNVGYGYWGHDIGGHMQAIEHPTNPEMYTRWLQYGVFTPIFKTHSTQNANLERKIWAYPTHYEYMKEAIELRYALAPYIYSAARTATETGVCITRPLYYVYPEEDFAYDFDQEFFFGEDILATVIDTPVDENGYAPRTMWFPAGTDWYDMAAHTMREGDTVQLLYYTIDQNPWYVRAGAIIPMAPEGIKNLQGIGWPEYRLLVVPGAEDSQAVLYEDDGMSCNYANAYAKTVIRRHTRGGHTEIVVEPRQGTYAGAPTHRLITIEAEGVTELPAKVTLNGKSLTTYELRDGHLVITLPNSSVEKKLVVKY